MKLIIKHRTIRSGQVEHWFIRGLSEDGKFYGEIRHDLPEVPGEYQRANAILWTGELTPTEARKVQALANRLADDLEIADALSGRWLTSIFKGPIGSDSVVRLAAIDDDGRAFPAGSGELVKQILEIMNRYTGEQHRKKLGSE